jgi:hypothetical protein
MGFTNKQRDGDNKERVKIKAITLLVVDFTTLTKMEEERRLTFSRSAYAFPGRICLRKVRWLVRSVKSVSVGAKKNCLIPPT